MRIARRLLLLALAASGLLIAGASTAAAAAPPYPIPPPVVTVDTGTIIVGQSVIVSGINFGPNENVDVVPNFQGAAVALGRSARGGLVAAARVQTVTDSNGTFHVPVQLDQVGRYLITATGLTTGRTGSVIVRVLPLTTEPPHPSVVININKTIVVKGDIIIVSGCNFEPGESVNVRSAEKGKSGQLGRSARSGLKTADDGQTVADNIGCFSFNVHPDKSGKHQYEAVGEKSGRRGSADVDVLDESANLPVTGNDGSNMGTLLVGSAVAATGIVLLVLARSRRRRTKIDS